MLLFERAVLEPSASVGALPASCIVNNEISEGPICELEMTINYQWPMWSFCEPDHAEHVRETTTEWIVVTSTLLAVSIDFLDLLAMSRDFLAVSMDFLVVSIAFSSFTFFSSARSPGRTEIVFCQCLPWSVAIVLCADYRACLGNEWD